MEYQVRMPIIYNSSFQPERTITPIDCDITLSEKPLSTAHMIVNRDDAPPMHGWVEMFTPNKSAGIYRVSQVVDAVDGAGVKNITLEHGICVLRDAIASITETATRVTAIDVRSTQTEVKFSGTPDQVTAACIAYQAQDPGYTPEWRITTEDNNSYFEGTPAEILRQILAYQTITVGGAPLWAVGTVEPTDEIKIKVDYSVCLDLIDTLMDELPDCMLTFDQSAIPWQIGIIRKQTQVTAEGRLTRNMTKAEITYDDSELYTRVYMDDLPNGYMDADTVSIYGIIGNYQKSGNALTQQEKIAICQQFLDKHKNPQIQIDIDGQDLYQITGVPVDGVEIGALYRVALPDYGLTINQHVITLYYPSVYGDPGAVQITLANDTLTLVSKLAEMVKSAGGAAAGGAARDKALEEETERAKIRYDLKVEYDKKHFQILATEEEWSDAWDDYFLTHKTKFYQDARKFRLIASEQAYNDLEAGDTTLKEVWDANLELTAQKLNVVFTDTEYEDLKQIREDTGGAYMDATMFSLIFSHNDLLDIINSRKTMFKVQQDAINLRVEYGAVATELAVECGNVTITGGNLVVDGYVTATAFDGLEARFNNLVSGRTAATSILSNSVSAQNSLSLSRNGSLTLWGTAMSSRSKTVVTGITLNADGTVNDIKTASIAYVGWA